jgi:lantibiotic modifying enzyme
VLATLLRVGQLTGDDALIEEAVRRSHEVAALPTPSPDLYNGFAGVARAVALVAAATADPGVVALAARTGDELIRRATVTDDGWCWEFPAGFGSMSVAPQLGYAHGAAGVAGALLDVYELTGEERFAAAADRGLDWLAHQSLPASPGGRGVGWPSQPGGPIHAPAWCHGAGGIGLAFLDAARLGVRADALDIALGAAEYLLARGRVISPCQCHGLAGHLELLLDLHQHSGDARWRTECDEMVTLMRAFRFRRDGVTRWQGEHPGTPALGYMTGGPGIALALLRLLEADRRPRQLTLAGFAYRPALAGADLTACASSAR